MSDTRSELRSFISNLESFYEKETLHLITPRIQVSMPQKLVESFIAVLHYVQVISNLLYKRVDSILEDNPEKTSLEVISYQLKQWRVSNFCDAVIIIPYLEGILAKPFQELPLEINKLNSQDLIDRLILSIVHWRLSSGQ